MIALFTYGGGMRGLIPAHLMAKIETMTGLRMADMVDVFAGPSTGSILNAAITRRHPEHPGKPMYRARHLVKFYEREGLNIFPPDSYREMRGILHDFNNRTLKLSQLNWLLRHGHYDPANLGRAMMALLGEAKLGDSLKSLIIPAYNIDGEQLEVVEERDENGDTPARTKNNFTDKGGHAVWLKHMRQDYPEGTRMKTPDVRLYDAVMASCAAPTYFPCHHFEASFPDERGNRRDEKDKRGEHARFTRNYTAIDGSIFDNPCISYLGAIRRHVPEDTNLTMIVLGTGHTNRSFKKEDWNRYGALGVVDPVNDLPLINIFFYASETALMDSFAEEMRGNLFVFNKSMLSGKPGSASPQIDDASPQQIRALANFAEEIYEENKQQFHEVCDILVRNYESREKETTRKNGFLSERFGKYTAFLTGVRRRKKKK
jgi:predicted acylesterase/phospholipase RssA